MDLFRDVRKKNMARVAPLAARMRPRTLDEFVGQEHFLGPGKLLRRMLEADRLTSVIFYGPPGTGKTTLAQLIATNTKSHFEQVNAASVGVKEVRKILDDAKERLANTGERSVLFLDEIHRFNRAQQDILLPDVEAGLVLLVGATTENPFFAVNSPLISRSQIFQFAPISEEDIRKLVRRALADPERGFGKLNIQIDDAAVDLWATKSDGDARRALMALEVAVLSLQKEKPEASSQKPAKEEENAPPHSGSWLLAPLPSTSPSTSPSSRFSARRSFTTGRATSTTTPPAPSSSPCADRIPTPPCIGSRACLKRAKTRVS